MNHTGDNAAVKAARGFIGEANGVKLQRDIFLLQEIIYHFAQFWMHIVERDTMSGK